MYCDTKVDDGTYLEGCVHSSGIDMNNLPEYNKSYCQSRNRREATPEQLNRYIIHEDIDLDSFCCGDVITTAGECPEGENPCDPNATCENIVGGFTCTCNDGFVGDGTTCTISSGSGSR